MNIDILIIGGGVAGMTAALYAKRAGKSILILEKEAFGGQIATSPLVENFPTQKSITGADLADSIFNQVLDLGVEWDLDEVTSITKDEQTKIFNVKTVYHEYQASSVIIAAGVKPRKLNAPREQEFIGKGVSYCAVCDGAFYKGKDVCVIGDANTAMQYALMLADTSPKVTMCLLFDHFFGSKDLQDKVLNKENIEVIYQVSLKEFVGTTNVESLIFEKTTTKETIEVKASGCFIAIGQEPHNEIFKDLVDINKNGYIEGLEDGTMTKTEGLYVAGDCREKKYKQVTTACSDGTQAALNAINYLNKK